MIRALKLARLAGVRRYNTDAAAPTAEPTAPIVDSPQPITTQPDNIPPTSIFDEADDDDAWILPRTGKKKPRISTASTKRKIPAATSTSKLNKELALTLMKSKAPITPNVAFNNKALGSGLIVLYHPDELQIEFVLSQIRKYLPPNTPITEPIRTRWRPLEIARLVGFLTHCDRAKVELNYPSKKGRFTLVMERHTDHPIGVTITSSQDSASVAIKIDEDEMFLMQQFLQGALWQSFGFRS